MIPVQTSADDEQINYKSMREGNLDVQAEKGKNMHVYLDNQFIDEDKIHSSSEDQINMQEQQDQSSEASKPNCRIEPQLEEFDKPSEHQARSAKEEKDQTSSIRAHQASAKSIGNRQAKQQKDETSSIQAHQASAKSIGKIKVGLTSRIDNINKEAEQLNLSLSTIKEMYSDVDMKEMLFQKRNIDKQEEIKKFIRKKNKEENQRRKKMAELRQKEAKQLQQSFALQDQRLKKQGRSRAERELARLQEAKRKSKQAKQDQAQKDKQVEEMFHQIRERERHRKKFHLRKEEEDQQKKNEENSRQKSYLAKRRQNYLRLDVKELNEHEIMYDKKIKQLGEVKRAEREEKYRNILANNNQYLQVYRGANYQNAQDEYLNRSLKKNKVSPEMSKKMKNYEQYVRENFSPKSSKVGEKQYGLESQSMPLSLSLKSVKRERSVNGVSFAQVQVNKLVPKSKAEIKKIGNTYLMHLKSLPKKPKEDPEKELHPSDTRNSDSILMPSPRKRPLLERKQSLQLRLSCQPTRGEIDMLLDRLKERDRQIQRKETVVRCQEHKGKELREENHEINIDIVENIQRKLSLLRQL